ncbi:MAG: DNA repair protein RadA [Planctomycetota bacterium]
MVQIKKPKHIYVCQNCGAQSPKWLGRCNECGEWNSLIEETALPLPKRTNLVLGAEKPLPLSQIKQPKNIRTPTGLLEFDRLLGGGIVKGSVILLGGDPGIGKSTILLQVCSKLALNGLKVLYVSAEESIFQTKMRAERLKTNSDNLLLVSETNLNTIIAYINEFASHSALAERGSPEAAGGPDLVVIDSIQMIYKSELPGAPGTLTQLRECATELVYLAKRQGVSLCLIGHVTKEGAIAGPKSLEHIVDTVLYFEGDRFQSFRILRAVKNRFGSTNEIAIFEMQESGLTEVANPSGLFISQREEETPGSVVVPTIIGTRTLLVEIQALTARSYYATPARRVSGVDFNRTMMILAVLERRINLASGGQDVFVNAVGGVQVDEPAADLGIALAIASSMKNKPLPKKIICVGEVGLSGEVRAVNQINNRIKEAQRMGFKQIILPKQNNDVNLTDTKGITISKVSSLYETLDIINILGKQ